MKEVNNILIVIAILCLASCQNQKTRTITGSSESVSGIEITSGDLYFKLINIGNFYGASDSIINIFEKGIDSLNSTENITEEDKLLLDYFNLLEKHELLYKPYFHLRIDSTQTKIVYLSESEYEKIKIYDRQQLINENKKVKIKLNGKTINEGIIDCIDIISTEKVDGKTYWRK